MRHVEAFARELLDRRPAQSVPREVQHADGGPLVDRMRLLQLRRAVKTVAPGTRKNGDVDWTVTVGRRELKQAGRKAAGVLADPGRMFQRRTVIEHDAHLCKSFRLSILL